MARTDTLGNFLTDVADAIRTKTGSQATIQASDFDTEIENIPSGSSGWSDAGYSSDPKYIQEIHQIAKSAYDNFIPENSTSKIGNSATLVICPMVDTSQKTPASGYFSDYRKLVEVPALTMIARPITWGNIMFRIFENCSSLVKVDLSNFDTTECTSFLASFAGCSSLENLDLSPLNTSKATTMQEMFRGDTNLKNIVWGNNWDTSEVTTMQGMFSSTGVFDILDLTNFNVKKVTTMQSMFSSCQAKEIDISNWETDSLTNMQGMFQYCYNIATINFGENFDTSKVTNMSGMFSGSTKLDDNTLNAILKLCIGTTSAYTGTKNLKALGITNATLVAKIPNLSNYQDFLDAGWTIS